MRRILWYRGKSRQKGRNWEEGWEGVRSWGPEHHGEEFCQLWPGIGPRKGSEWSQSCAWQGWLWPLSPAGEVTRGWDRTGEAVIKIQGEQEERAWTRRARVEREEGLDLRPQQAVS